MASGPDDPDSKALDPNEASLFKLGVVTRSYERSWEIEIDVSVNSPQALLRDLHRVESTYHVNPMEMKQYGDDDPRDCGRADVRAIRRTMTGNYIVPVWDLAPTEQLWRNAWSDLRGVINGQWADTPRRATKKPEGE